MEIIDLRIILPAHETARWGERRTPPDLLCIHHSVTPGDCPIERIAEYHIGRGRPGICYHYVVDASGKAYWCNDDMLFTWHGHDGNTGLGICLLGDFTENAPPEAQLAAAAELVASLKQKWHITKVIGHCEARRAHTQCPGLTWPQWASRLKEIGMSADPFAKYPRPPEDTGAGAHLSAGFAHPFGENEALFAPMAIELRLRGLTWAKLGDMGGTSIKPCQVLLDRGVMPVVRMYQQRPYIHQWEQKERETLAALATLGVRYIEDDNERNLQEEWPVGQWPGEGMPFDELVEAWYERGQYVTGLGMYYAIPSLAPGGHYDDITYLLNWLRAVKLCDGAMSMLHDWGWVSIHPAALNHPLDYPDDAVNQREHPGQTIHTHYYADGAPTGASNCWRKWEAVEKIVADILGFPLPIIATEGGAWPGSREDGRYPALTEQEASKRQFEMLHFMATAPAYFLANCPWLLANREMGNLDMAFEAQAWLQAGGKRLPIWEMLRVNPCQKREATMAAITEADRAEAREQISSGGIAFLDKAATAMGLNWLGKEWVSGGYTLGVAQVPGAMRFKVLKVPTGQWELGKVVVGDL